MYSVRVSTYDDGPRLELFCNRCGVIYKFISQSVAFDDVQHIVGGHDHFSGLGGPIDVIPSPHFF